MHAKRKRIQRLLELHEQALERARGALFEATAAEERARNAYEAACEEYRNESNASMQMLAPGACGSDFANAANWRSALSHACDRARLNIAQTKRNTDIARKHVEDAYRSAETMRALLRRIDKEIALEASRALRREEDAFALLQRAASGQAQRVA